MIKTYDKLGRRAEAVAACRNAVIAVKPDAGEYYRIADVYHDLEQYADAIAIYEKCAAVDQSGTQANSAYARIGLIRHELKRYAKAVVAYKMVIALKPDEIWAYGMIGEACGELGRHAESKAAYNKAAIAYEKLVALKPDANAYAELGYIYCQTKQYPKAIAAFKECLSVEPTGLHAYRAYVQTGEIYNKSKQYAEAVAACRKAIDLGPTSPWAYFTMGEAYRLLKQNELAVDAYRKAVTLEPEEKTLALARKHIIELSKK